ncbi:MAG: PQQ-dependent sugar dehydrogenase [Clostridia bacterium]|nr:PQQ-dependent sugar dehydrogenase [Clostridia bacterium]
MRERGSWAAALLFAAAVVIAGLLWAGRPERASEPAGPSASAPPLAASEGSEPPPAPEGPPGDDPRFFTRSLFADGLAQPTAMAFAPDGSLYVTELGGRVAVLKDQDGDGRAEVATFATGLASPLGVAVLRDGDVVVSERGRITRLRDTDGDGRADRRDAIVTGLPVGRHQNDAVVVGLDNRLYWGQGSRTDHGEGGVLAREAAVLSADLDGTDLTVVARGLRNPYGLAFDPATGELFATDNGRDTPEGVPDELNVIHEGADYGWPDCWGDGGGRNCEGTEPPVALFPDHSSADGIAVYRGTAFPAEYDGAVFVALWGANSGDEAIGRKVVVALRRPGGRFEVQDFATGFEHPLAVAVDRAGRLYVADMGAGTVTVFTAARPSR